MKTADVENLISRKFPQPECAAFYEVCDDVNGGGRRADVLVMNLWRSRGLELQGFEVKVSRSDWLREMKKPAKAESIMRYCDRWWLVVGDESIVKDDELPVNWGLMYVKGGKLFTKVKAPQLSPVAIDRPFLASICRRATEGMIPASSITDEVNRKVELAVMQKKSYEEQSRERTERKYQELRSMVDKFEKASGISMNSYWADGERLGKALRYFIENGVDVYLKNLKQEQVRREQELKNINEAIEELNKYSEKTLA